MTSIEEINVYCPQYVYVKAIIEPMINNRAYVKIETSCIML